MQPASPSVKSQNSSHSWTWNSQSRGRHARTCQAPSRGDTSTLRTHEACCRRTVGGAERETRSVEDTDRRDDVRQPGTAGAGCQHARNCRQQQTRCKGWRPPLHHDSNLPPVGIGRSARPLTTDSRSSNAKFAR